MRPLYLRVWALLLAGALILAPAAALAQELSPGTRAAIANGAAAGASLIPVAGMTATPSIEVALPDQPDVDEEDVDEPEIDEPEVDEPEIDEPEIVEPEDDELIEDDDLVVEEEVVEDEVVEEDGAPLLPVSGEWVTHENVGLTIETPAEWDVLSTTMFDNLFTMEIPDSEFVGLIQGGDALDFPGVMAVIIMRSLPEFIVAQFGEGATLVDVQTYLTPQDLPVVKIEFEADLEGMIMAGAFYVISPGATAYIMIAIAPPDLWEDVRDDADQVAATIQFAPELISLEIAQNEAIFMVDEEEMLEIVLPPGWLGTTTGDPALPILAVSPGYEYVAGLTASRDDVDDVVALLDEAIIGDEINQDIVDMVLDLMSGAMSLQEDMFGLDLSMSEIFVVRDELVLRLVGGIEIDVGVEMPAGIYVGLRRDGISALIVFGDIDQALADEEILIEILDSLLFIR